MKQRAAIVSTLRHHLADEKGKAILLAGPWGCGKTYLWRHDILPAFDVSKPIYVSLFGADSLASFKALLLSASLRRRGALIGEKKWKKGVQGGLDLVSAGLKKTIDRFIGDKILSATIDLLQLIDDGLVVCIDDFERASPSIPLEELLGVVAALAETRNARVLIIMNEEHLLERGDKTADVLRRFKERVVMAGVVADSDVLSFYETMASGCSDIVFKAYLIELRDGIVSLFERTKHSNLRTIIRLIDAIRSLWEALKPFKPSSEQIQFLGILFIENQSGDLRPSDFYDFNDLVLGLNRREIKDLDDKTKARMNFRARYLGQLQDRNRYSYYDSLYSFVSRGFLDAAVLEAELNPKAPQLGPVEILLNEIEGRDWLFLSDQDVASLVQKIEDLLIGTVPLPTAQIVALIVYARAMVDRAGMPWSSKLEDAIKRRLAENAAAGDKTFSRVEEMRFSPQETVWAPYLDHYDETISAKEGSDREKEALHLIDSLNTGTLAKAIGRRPEMLRTVTRDPSLSEVLQSWKKDRRFQYVACGLVIEELNAYGPNIMPDIMEIRAAFRDRLKSMKAEPELDNSMRRQVDSLLLACAAWEPPK